jgi:hypothetical protein
VFFFFFFNFDFDFKYTGQTGHSWIKWVGPNPIIQNFDPLILCWVRSEFAGRVKN